MFHKLFRSKYWDNYSSWGNEYILYNKGVPEAFTKINTTQRDFKNIYPDSIVFDTDKCDIKDTSTPTKHVPNTDKHNIKHKSVSTKHGLAGSLLSQFHKSKKISWVRARNLSETEKS